MSLSDWLVSANDNNVGEGIAEIGPEAIRFLARKINPPNPLLNKFYISFWKALPGKFRLYLTSPNIAERVRQNALSALKEFGPEARPALPHVIEAARNDPSASCRTFAARAALAIGYDKPAVTALFAELLNNPATADAAALAPLFAARFPSNCLPYFIVILGNQQKLPYNALLGLSVLGPEARETVPLIVPALNDPKLQIYALTAIFRIGQGAEPAIPALMKIVESPGESSVDTVEALVTASEALMNIGPKASPAVPALKRLMTNDEVMVRIIASAAVAKITGDPSESIPVLIRGLAGGEESELGYWRAPARRPGLENRTFGARMTAAWLLGDLGTDSSEALHALKTNLNNCSEWLAPALARSIWKLEGKPTEVMNVLRQALRAKESETRVIACMTLAEIGPAAVDALPDLVAASRMSLNTRQAVIFAMRKLKPGSTLH